MAPKDQHNRKFSLSLSFSRLDSLLVLVKILFLSENCSCLVGKKKMNVVLQLCVDKFPLKSIVRLMAVSKSLLIRFLTCECKFLNERVAHYFYEHQEAVNNVDLDGGCERVEISIPTGYIGSLWRRSFRATWTRPTYGPQ